MVKNKIESALCECGNATFFFITINKEKTLLCSKCGVIVNINNFIAPVEEEKNNKSFFVR